MNILVTGGAGFIGSHLCRRLVALGNEVVAVDNLSSGNLRNIEDLLKMKYCFKFIDRDLRIYGNLATVMRGVDQVYHLAANMGGIGYISEHGAEIMHDNLYLDMNFFEAVKNLDVEDAVYASSACVYPVGLQLNPMVEPLKESDAYPADPDQFYGWEKLTGEKLCEAYNNDYGLNVRVLRYHNVFGEYGSWDEKGKAPMQLIKKAIDHPDPPFTIWGDGEQTRSFLYVDDAVEGTIKRMTCNYLKPINIGSDRLVNINDLAWMIAELSGKHIEPIHDLTKTQGVRGRNADLSYARTFLGWEPKISLEEGLRRTYAWCLNHAK